MDVQAYDELPFNGLAAPSEIIDEQMRRLGILPSDFDFNDTMMSDTSTNPATTASGATTDAPVPSTVPVRDIIYDGPADTKKTMGEMLEQYGVPTSAGTLLTAAESAIIDIPRELYDAKEPVWEILTKEERLQGIGALLIVVAVIIGVISLLR